MPLPLTANITKRTAARPLPSLALGWNSMFAVFHRHRPAARHRVPSVQNEIDDDLLHVTRIRLDAVSLLEIEREANALPQQQADHLVHARDQLARLHDLGLQLPPAVAVLKALYERRPQAAASWISTTDARKGILGGDTGEQAPAVAGNRVEQRFEVGRDRTDSARLDIALVCPAQLAPVPCAAETVASPR